MHLLPLLLSRRLSLGLCSAQLLAERLCFCAAVASLQLQDQGTLALLRGCQGGLQGCQGSRLGFIEALLTSQRLGVRRSAHLREARDDAGQLRSERLLPPNCAVRSHS